MFLEQAHAVLRNKGLLGFIVPAALYADKGTTDLRSLFLASCEWRWLFSFENRDKIFDIDGRFKFCPIIVQKGGKTKAIQTAFMRRDPHDWDSPESLSTMYTRSQIDHFSPASHAILEIRSGRDLEALEAIYDNCILIGAEREKGWKIEYGRELNMTSDSVNFPPTPSWEEEGFVQDQYGRWCGPSGEVALPLYEGRMIGQFDFCEKGWVSGKGRGAVWQDIAFFAKHYSPQFLLTESFYAKNTQIRKSFKFAIMRVSSATNERTSIAAVIPNFPSQHSVFTGTVGEGNDGATLVATTLLNSYVFDYVVRQRCAGINLTAAILNECPLPQWDQITESTRKSVIAAASSLSLIHFIFSPQWMDVKNAYVGDRKWFSLWAITPHERLRLRAILDAVVAELYGLDWDDLAWILRDCDHPTAQITNNAFARVLDPKGFWRIDKDQPPELRHTVLTLAAFADLKAAIAARGGDREAGIADFCAAHDGEGWMLPETLRLADLGLGHDDRAQHPQPVRARMGERFLSWQLEQSAEESWAECERHARNLLGKAGFEALKAQLDNPTATLPPAGEPPRSANGTKKNALGDDFELVMDPPKDGGQTKLF